MLATLTRRMIEYNGTDVRRIGHALKVTSFATLIAQLEGCEPDLVETIAVAAVLHDIGMHEAEARHGSTSGKYQELEGPAVASELMAGLDIPEAVQERVCFIVGHHHTIRAIDGPDFQILVEADHLVNAFDDRLSAGALMSVREKVFRTRSGLALFESMYTGAGLEKRDPEQ